MAATQILNVLKQEYNEVVIARQWQAALIILEQLMQLQAPVPLEFYFKRGLLRIRLQQYNAALQDLRKVLQMDGSFRTQIIAKLKIEYNKLARRHDWQAALAVINQAITLHPRPSARLYCKRAMVFIKLRQYRLAQLDLKRALTIDPDYAKARQMKARLQQHEYGESTWRFSQDPVDLESMLHAIATTDEGEEGTTSTEHGLVSHLLVPEQSVAEVLCTQAQHTHLGRYRLLFKIGSGGMGEVYKVYDTQLDRIVALKLIQTDNTAGSHEIERFQREARATARLRHPNIVALHDIGNHQGRHYFTMDYIEGVSFKTFLQQNEPGLTKILEIIITVARAVDYAHGQGIIHRDLKPTNIIIDQKGVPHVMDFGLAKIIHLQDDLSQSGETLGTPAYIPPEQVNSCRIDPRVDVYALGATLYEAITGRPPFQGENSLNILYQVVNREPVMPRTLNPDLPAELEAICLKCLEKRPARRYARALFLANDLENFLHHRPILARPPTAWTHIYKFARRHWMALLASLLVLLSLCTGSVVALVQWRHALIASREAQKQTRIANQSLAAFFYEKTLDCLEQKQYNEAAIFAAQAYFKDQRHYYAGLFEDTTCLTPLLGMASVGEDTASNVVISPDGQRYYTAHYDYTVRCWNMHNDRLLATYRGHSQAVRGLAMAPSGNFIASGDYAGLILIRNTHTGQIIKKLRPRGAGRIYTLAVAPDEQSLAAADSTGQVYIWSKPQWELCKRLRASPHSVMHLKYRPDGKLLVAATAQGGRLVCWSWPAWQEHAIMISPIAGIWGFDFYNQGQGLALADRGGRIQFRDSTSGHLLASINKAGTMFCEMVSTPEQTLFLSSDTIGRIKIWHRSKQRLVASILAHSKGVRRIAFTPNGKSFISTGLGGTIKRWQWRCQPAPFGNPGKPVLSLAYCEQGRYLFSGRRDGVITQWDSSSGKLLRSITIPEHLAVVQLACQPGQPQHLGVISKKIFRLIDWRTHQNICRIDLLGSPSGVPITFTPDGDKVLLVFKFGVLKLFSTKTGKLVRCYDKHRIDVYATAIHAHQPLMASGGFDKSICLWNWRTGQCLQRLDGHHGSISVLQFYQNRLVSGSMDSSLKIWDISNGHLLKTLQAHTGRVTCLAVSPDRHLIASGDENGQIILWQIPSGHVKIILHGHTQRVCGLHFSSDSRILFSAGEDGRIHGWRLAHIPAPGACLQHIQKITGLHIRGIQVQILSPASWRDRPR